MKTKQKARIGSAVAQGPRRERTSRVNEEPSRELRFSAGDERSGRVGDPAPARRLRDEFPATRNREAGRTGGEMVDSDMTADDATPETLLDSEPSHSPDSRHGRGPLDADTSIKNVDAIGAGRGRDEAELAERRPVGDAAADATRRTAHRHAADANAFEPHETEELAAAARARDAKRRQRS